jgi:E3 ubiquitin-protein ligase TRIP12
MLFSDALRAGSASGQRGSGSSASRGGGVSNEYKYLLDGLNDFGDEMRQMATLQDLCELLSVSTEETLGSFNVDPFIAPLMTFLGMESNPEMSHILLFLLLFLAHSLPTRPSGIPPSFVLNFTFLGRGLLLACPRWIARVSCSLRASSVA